MSERQTQTGGVPFEALGLVESLSLNRILDFPKIDGRRLIDLVTETFAKRRSVVRINLGVESGAGDGDVAEAGVEQVRVDGCVGVDEDALGGEALGAVAGDGVTVVEVALFGGARS